MISPRGAFDGFVIIGHGIRFVAGLTVAGAAFVQPAGVDETQAGFIPVKPANTD